ncbi:hypothetical protein FS842_002385 [Serendipita sp. 407]|nr:hypothetical protein FS842_002385 [Serendipita sp. 407]
MSGGVKIGSIIPRGQNGVIEEEEEDEDEDAEEPVESAETFEKATNSTAAISTQGQHPPQSQTQPGGSSSALPAQAVSQPHAMPVPQSAPITTSTYISSAQSNVPGQPPTVIIQKRTIVANSSPGIHSYTNSGSPVASVNGGQSTPIEYCGDFRTTGHCRFGPRCRYSHDIEPRVKSMNTATTIKYRPILRSDPSTHPPNTEMLNPLPPLPAGYQISNIMPQPHHIPGVPLSQQPPSPFVFSTPAAVAHPKTSPATTAAAARGELMADKEKATKILKSLGLSPHQAAPHQPAPVVLADGEISYNLNVGRSGIFRDITRPPSGSLKPSKYAPYIQAKDAETEARETQEMLITRFGPGAAPRAQPSVTEEDVSRSRPAEDEEDVWRVSAERQRHAVDTSNQPAESSNRNVPHDLHQQPVEERRRLYTPAQPPPSYSAQTVTYSTHLSQPSPYAQPIAHSSAPVAAYPSAAQQAGGQSISVSPEYLAALLTAAQKGIAAPSSHHPPQVSYASQPTVYGHAAVPQPQAILQHPQHIAYHSHPPQHQPPFQYPAAAQPHVVPHHHQQQQQQQHLPLQHPQMQYPAGAYTNLHHMPF